MAILNVKTETVGQAGLVPKFIYISTNNTLAEVQSVGFLAPLVSQGIALSDADVAVVSTKVTPNAIESETYLFKIIGSGASVYLSPATSSVTGAVNVGTGEGVYKDILGGNLRFKSIIGEAGKIEVIPSGTDEIQIKAGTGLGFDPAYSYDASGPSNPAITGDWLHQGGFNVQAGSGNVVLQSDVGDVSVVAPTPGQLVAIQGDQVQIASGLQNLQLTSTGADVVIGASVGDVNLLSTSDISLDSSSVLLPSIPNSVGANTLYYDSVSKQVSWGLAPGGGADWHLSGMNSGAGLLFGTNSADGWSYQANSVAFASVSALGETTYTGALYVNGIFEVDSPENVVINTNPFSNKNITIGASGNLLLSSVSGYGLLNTASVFPTPALGEVIIAAARDLRLYSENNDIHIQPQFGSINISTGATGNWLAYSDGSLTLSSFGTMIQTSNVQWRVTASSYELMTLPSAQTPNIVYYNTVNKELSYGLAPTVPTNLWYTDGSNSGGPLFFGTNAAVGWTYQVNSIAFATVSSTGVTAYSGDLYANGRFEVHSPENVIIQTNNGTAKNVTIEADLTLNLISTTQNIIGNSAGNTQFIAVGTFNATCGDFVASATNNANILCANQLLVRSSAGNVLTQATLGSLLETAAVAWEVTAPVYKLNSLAAATKPDLVYFDSVTKELSYGAAPSLPSNLWLTDGSNSGLGLVLGTNSADGWSYQANSVSFATVSSAGFTTYTGGFQANGAFGVNSPSAMTIRTAVASGQGIEMYGDSSLYFEATNSTAEIYCGSHLYLSSDANIQAVSVNNIHLFASQLAILRSTTNNVSLEAPTANILQSAGVDWQVTSPSYKLMTLPAASSANIVYYDSTTKALSYGAAPVSSVDWKIDGTNSGAGLLFGTNSAAGWTYQANSVSFATVNAAGASVYTGAMYLNGIFEVHSPQNVVIQTNNGTAKTITVEADANLNLISTTSSIINTANTSWEVNAPAFKLNTLPSGTKPLSVYYDFTSKEISYGGTPKSALSWQIESSTSATLIDNTGMIATNVALTTFTLPATAAVGETYRIAGASAGLFTVAQNAGQSIRLGNTVSTVGVGGSVSSTNTGDCLEILCITANTSFMIISSTGNYNVV